MQVADRKTARTPAYVRWALPLLNDPRDGEFVGFMLGCFGFAAAGVGMFFSGPLLPYLAPVYLLVLAFGFLDRFTLLLHCTSHRPLFKPKHRALNEIVPWVLGPFFGQTPETYFAHHMGMHHPEENLPDDLSTTMPYHRDRFLDFLHYWAKFLFLGLVDLSRYMARKGRYRLLRRIFLGEGVYWVVVVGLLLVRPAAALVVFVGPLVLIRTLMMMGNWGQHAFVSQSAPESPYVSSITCINSRYNRRCFNDGYHIGHHLQARAHWTELPVEFEKNIELYVKNDAIVFQGIDFFLVWLLLMTKRWRTLARAYVRLPGAPERSEAEIIALLRERVRPFPA
ncbi:MAG TPA: fatty acid desaturase [Polyangiaceae bacterium]|nr:fatty acid desaturase [Polyangiaceae bacterium]